MEFANQGEAAKYIEDQSAQGLPAGWSLRRQDVPPLNWRIVPGSTSGWSDVDYILEVTEDLHKIILYHGNDDHGALGLHLFLLRAMVIGTDGLERFSLAEVLRRTIGKLQPNHWGMT
jgi:hypothetical protein